MKLLKFSPKFENSELLNTKQLLYTISIDESFYLFMKSDFSYRLLFV